MVRWEKIEKETKTYDIPQNTTKIAVEETKETVTSLKYLWGKDDGVNEPNVTLFTQNCPSDGIITNGNDTMTGTYYLWTLLIINFVMSGNLERKRYELKPRTVHTGNV